MDDKPGGVMVRGGLVALAATSLLGAYSQLPLYSLALQAAVFGLAASFLLAGGRLWGGDRWLGWAATALAATLAISATLSVDRAASLFSLGQWVSYGMAAWLAASAFRPGHGLLIAQYVLLLGVLMAGIAVYFYWGEAGNVAMPVMSSILGNKNHFGGFLLMVLPLALALYLEAPSSREKLAYGCVSVLLGSAFMLTYSRGAWFAFAPGLALVAWGFRGRPELLPGRLGLVAAASVGLSFLMAQGALAQALDLGYQGALSIAQAAAGAEAQGTLTPRLDYWQGALRILGDHPTTGSGLGTYGEVFPTYQRSPLFYSRFAHDFFLQMGAEAGVPALLAALVLFATLLAGWAKSFGARPAAPSDTHAISAGLAAGLVASTLHNLVDLDWYIPAVGLLFSLEAGLYLAVADKLHGCRSLTLTLSLVREGEGTGIPSQRERGSFVPVEKLKKGRPSALSQSCERGLFGPQKCFSTTSFLPPLGEGRDESASDDPETPPCPPGETTTGRSGGRPEVVEKAAPLRDSRPWKGPSGSSSAVPWPAEPGALVRLRRPVWRWMGLAICVILFASTTWRWTGQLVLVQADTSLEPAGKEALLQVAASLNPLDGEPHFRLAELVLDQAAATGEVAGLERGILEAREALARNPANDAYRALLARLYLSAGHLDPAIAELKSLVDRLQPLQAPDAYRQLGEAYLRQGRTQEALQLYRRLLAGFPQGPDTPQPPQPGALSREEAASLLAEAHLAIGNVYAGEGQAGKAREEYLASLGLRPDSAQASFNLGMIEYTQQQWTRAFTLFQQAAALDPGYAPALYYRGLARLRLGQREEAAGDFQEALARDPRYEAARRELEGMR